MPPIRWRTKDIELLRKEVNRFNAKLRRLEKSGTYTDVPLPSRLNAKDLMNTITTRREFNRTIGRVNRFFEKGANTVITNPQGVKLLTYSVKEAKRDLRLINRRKKEEYDRVSQLPTFVGTTGATGLTAGEMGDDRLVELQPKSDRTDKVRSTKEWDMFVQSLEKQRSDAYLTQRRETLQANFIASVEKELWLFAEEIVPLVKDYTPDEFYYLYIQNPDLAIRYVYAEEEMAVVAYRIIDILRAHPPKLED